MRRAIMVLVLAALAVAQVAQAQTVEEVRQTIIDANEEARRTLKSSADDSSKLGALEFWSSGGLLQEIGPGGRPDEYESISIDVKHIHVLPLVEGQAAVAMYYSEGSFKPKGYPAVTHYLTRVTQVFVKEGGEWKLRASHWSPVSGGSGTSQAALDRE